MMEKSVALIELVLGREYKNAHRGENYSDFHGVNGKQLDITYYHGYKLPIPKIESSE